MGTSASPARPPHLLPATLVIVTGLAVLTTGCASRFTARTDYLAPGFNRDSIRGKTVALLPPEEPAYQDELAGIADGMSEAGARVRIVRLPVDFADDAPDRPIALPPAAQPRFMGLALPPRRLGRDVGAAYALVVRFTEATVYRAYAMPQDRGGAGYAAAAERTSGRRVGVRLELVRLSDGQTQWAAHGTGETWRTRTAAAPGAMPAAANVDDDIGSGNLDLYPDPPGAQPLSRRLVRRLLAHLPFPIEVLPS